MMEGEKMKNRAMGCLLGGAIGDAMGMPASFMSPNQIKKVYGRIDSFLEPEKEEQEYHGDLQAGEITDDTEETLIISEVLIENNGFSEKAFVSKMKDWCIDNDMLNSTVIGPSTRNFLTAIVEGSDYYEKGKLGDTNGAAMRVAPIGIYNHNDIDKAGEDAIASARPSHGSRTGLASAAAVSTAIAMGVNGNFTPEDIMVRSALAAEKAEEQGFDVPGPSISTRIRLAKRVVDENKDLSLEEVAYLLYKYIGASMKAYESVPLSLGVFYAAKGKFQDGLITIINIGDDADTNGAICSAICGAYSGIEEIKQEWIDKVQETNKIDFDSIAEKLLA